MNEPKLLTQPSPHQVAIEALSIPFSVLILFGIDPFFPSHFPPAECILKINFAQRCNFGANKFMCSAIDFAVQCRKKPWAGKIKGAKLGMEWPQTVLHFIKYEIRFPGITSRRSSHSTLRTAPEDILIYIPFIQSLSACGTVFRGKKLLNAGKPKD